jgi:serine-type D-Ala-D-Ala carboxypeptidase
MTHSRLLCWLFLLLPVFSFSQNNQGVLKTYQEALADLVLLRNEGNLLPLKGLDTLKVAYIGAAQRKQVTFQDFLERYTQVTTIQFPSIASASETQAWIRTQTQRFNFFIIGLEDQPASVEEPDYLADKEWIKGLMAADRVAVVLFSPNQALQKFPLLETAPVLVTSDNTQEGQSLAAQLIFGGTETKARLSKPLSPNHSFGAGLDLGPAIRLGYAPAELVGLDGQLLRDSIKALCEEGLRYKAYPGAQVLVAKDGKVVYHQAFGQHTYDNERPVRLTDVYDFASITKITTGLPVLMKWYGEGNFKLDDSLGVYLSEVKGSNKAGLSMRRILTHTAQLMAWIPFWRGTLKWNTTNPWEQGWNADRISDGDFKKRSFKPDSTRRYSVQVTDKLWLYRKYHETIYQSIYQSPLNAKPGFVYSDFFFYLMPKIVKEKTGKDFEAYIKSTFYRKIGAYSLTFNPLRFYPKEKIIPTERDTFFRMTTLHGRVHDEGASMLGGVSGHAGLFGSVNDLAKLMQTYLNFGTYGGERLIAEPAIREFIRCQYCEEGIHRGLGFDKPLITYSPERAAYSAEASGDSFGHTGYTGTYTWADPKTGILLIFFTNRVHPTRLNQNLFSRSLRRRMHESVYKARLQVESK